MGREGELSLPELSSYYVTRIYVLTGGNQTETAKRLGINWRTVGKMLDPALLARWGERKKTEE